MPSVNHNVMVTYGANITRATVKRGDTFRIFTNLSGDFRFQYTQGPPFQSTDPPTQRRPGGEEREATKVGHFPFRCFLDGVEFANPDGQPALAGEIEVTEG